METDATSSQESAPVSFTVVEDSIPSIQLFRYNETVVAEVSSLIVLNNAGISQVISLENSGWSPLVPSVSNTVVSLYKADQVIQVSSLSSEARSYLISQGWSTGKIKIIDVKSNSITVSITDPAGKTLKVLEKGNLYRTIPLTAADTVKTISGLMPNTAYIFQLLAAGASVYESADGATTLSAETVPHTQALRNYFILNVYGGEPGNETAIDTGYNLWLSSTYNTIDTDCITPFKYYYENVYGNDPEYPTYREWITLFGRTIAAPPSIPEPVEPDPGSADTITLGKVLNVVQTILDIAGFFPGIGDLADGINAGICLLRGDFLGAVFSGIALAPAVGSLIAAPLKSIFRALDNVSEVKAAINTLASIFGGIEKVVDNLNSILNTLKGLIRQIPDAIDSFVNTAFVRRIIGDEGIAAIGGMIATIRNKVDNLIGKTDEVVQVAESAATYVGKNADEIADFYASKVARKAKVSGKFTGSPSEILRAELKDAGVIAPPFSNQAHHIIPHGMYLSELNEARELMARYGVDLNSASNGVFLPNAPDLPYAGSATVHNGSHTTDYARYVANAILNYNPQSADDIITVLNDLRNQLLNGTLKINSLG